VVPNAAAQVALGLAPDLALGPEDLLTIGQWLSPAFPTGSFAYSHGLEQAIRDGQLAGPDGLSDWLADMLLHGAGRQDAILLHRAARTAAADLPALIDLALAFCPAAERRRESLAQGQAFAATVRAVWGHDLPDGPLPITLGRAAGLQGLPVRPVAMLYLQATVTALVQACQRLMPLGQTAAQRIVMGLAPHVAAVASRAETLSLDDLGGAALMIDLAAMRHESLEPRIFRS
jgi:urease accessory protein